MSTNEFLQRATKRVEKKKEVKEENIETPYVSYAKNKGCKALKLILLNKKGFPDRTTICPNGRIFFIEFKKKGKKPTPVQKAIRRLLESFGFEYYVCDVKGQAEAILDRFLSNG